MRNHFFRELLEIYKKDSNIVVLTGDLGFKLFDGFREYDDKRFYDVGVAEANMVSLAAGLSLCGMKVYCYSIIPFLIMRTFEQIRNDVAYHELDVKLVGVGGGLAYGLEGISHHAIEDIALMRTIPNMTIVSPSDQLEAGLFAQLSYENEGPMFIRLCHTNEPVVHEAIPQIEIGKPLRLQEGGDAVIFATGRTVHPAVEASRLLKEEGISTALVEMHTIQPLEKGAVLDVLEKHKLAITVEEHSLTGGLGTIIAELIADNGIEMKLKRMGIDRTCRYTGTADHLREKYGLTAANIANTVRSELNSG
jgi:transketolase